MAGLLASEAVSSGVWLWWLAAVVMVVLTLACAASFVLLLRRSNPSRPDKQDLSGQQDLPDMQAPDTKPLTAN